MVRRILIIGATSSLAQALCRKLAAADTQLLLAGRDEEELKRLAADVTVRSGVMPETFLLDLATPNLDFTGWADSLGDVDTVIIATGDMGGEDKDDAVNIERTVTINFTTPAKLLAAFATTMQRRGSGMLVVISSVAGDRGRQSNYLYGSAKAGLTAFASGLRNRLAREKIHVLTIRPGFIDTPLTYAMQSPLTCDRDHAATLIIRAMKKRKNDIYVPGKWRLIMAIIRNIPEPVFKRLRL